MMQPRIPANRQQELHRRLQRLILPCKHLLQDLLNVRALYLQYLDLYVPEVRLQKQNDHG